jgi:hypothetical protein
MSAFKLIRGGKSGEPPAMAARRALMVMLYQLDPARRAIALRYLQTLAGENAASSRRRPKLEIVPNNEKPA